MFNNPKTNHKSSLTERYANIPKTTRIALSLEKRFKTVTRFERHYAIASRLYKDNIRAKAHYLSRTFSHRF